ncbi:spore photoproduct lyase [Sporomusa acidovorans]|uniref:Spore photoproduct lyase n=2 Tax=Sporomusa TaxID=2375 RepID=A0ABZ3IZA3_SPOA4|nr:spore photoproduct lyase [Sporomusa acidovorans]OZC18297.1 spore photoproduct lyase [Sporomusa acidovorans DSM 3132]SDF20706.1 spore photoproduct lyase [Sporomusa acidovorans]
MKPFVPERAYFEPDALNYPLGQELYEKLQSMSVPITMTSSHNRITGITGKNAWECYQKAKRTLAVGVRRSLDFQSCKPSAHFQLPLNTGCPSMCEYCYLMTTLGKKPYLRVYVNIEDVLNKAAAYIRERAPEITIFEGAATSDPIPTEYLTGLLKQTIEFFGRQPLGRFRFVTKHVQVDTLLAVNHSGHTRFRFTLNAASVIKKYEHLTPPLAERVAAAAQVAQAGYPLGFIIAPVFYFPEWESEYNDLLKLLAKELPTAAQPITFEFITHRFTKRAKNNILELFSNTALPLDETVRQFKFGQFGYGKYLYAKEQRGEMERFLRRQTAVYFPDAQIDYFI